MEATYQKGDNSEILIGPDRELTVNLRNVAKADLVSTLSRLFGKGDRAAIEKLREQFELAPHITFTMTTKGK